MDPTKSISLEAYMSGFKKGQNSRCWCIPGRHLNFAPPEWTTDIMTFCLAHKQGEVSLGYMGFSEGCLTFFRKKSFSSIADARNGYPSLFMQNGYPYAV